MAGAHLRTTGAIQRKTEATGLDLANVQFPKFHHLGVDLSMSSFSQMSKATESKAKEAIDNFPTRI